MEFKSNPKPRVTSKNPKSNCPREPFKYKSYAARIREMQQRKDDHPEPSIQLKVPQPCEHPSIESISSPMNSMIFGSTSGMLSLSPSQEIELAHLRISSSPQPDQRAQSASRCSNREPTASSKNLASEVEKNSQLQHKISTQQEKYRVLEENYKKLLAKFARAETVYESTIHKMKAEAKNTPNQSQVQHLIDEIAGIKDRVLELEQLAHGLKNSL